MMLHSWRLILVVSLFLRLWSEVVVVLLISSCAAELKLELVDVVLNIFTTEPIYLHVISVWVMLRLNCKILLLLLLRHGVLAITNTPSDLSSLEWYRPAAPSSIAVLLNLRLRHVIYEWGDWLLDVVVILIIVNLQRLNLHHVRVVIDATTRRLSFLALLVGLTLLLSRLSE